MIEIQKDILSENWKVEEEVAVYLHETSVLAKYVAVLGMIFSVITTAKSVYRSMELMMRLGGDFFSGYLVGSVGGALLAGTVYFSIGLYTYRFAVKLQQALQSTDQAVFSQAWQQFKMAYRVMGVMFIIYLLLILAVIIF